MKLIQGPAVLGVWHPIKVRSVDFFRCSGRLSLLYLGVYCQYIPFRCTLNENSRSLYITTKVYSFKQHVTFHEGFKTVCVVPCRPLLPQPARCLFWTASRRKMSRASRPAHSQCSAIGQNCRSRLVFEFSYILYSIFHLPRHMVDPYIIFVVYEVNTGSKKKLLR